MITFIIKEFNEGFERVSTMIEQLNAVNYTIPLHLIFVSGSPFHALSWIQSSADFPVRIVGNVKSSGGAINTGALLAPPSSDALIIFDCHICFSTPTIARMINTLTRYPNSLVGFAIRSSTFPGCEYEERTHYGVTLRVVDFPFEWVWLPPHPDEDVFEVSMVDGCAFALKPPVFRHLYEYGGFLSDYYGVGWEEEAGIRLWRIGNSVRCDTKAVVGHMFKSSWSSESTRGWLVSRCQGIVANIFDTELYDQVCAVCENYWGQEHFRKELKRAEEKVGWIRRKLEPLKERIDERWFLRTT